MCSPTLVITSISTLMSMKSASDQASFEAGTANYNARVAENTAQKTINAGVEKENAQRLKTARLQAQQKAKLGSLNVDVASGSAAQLQEDTATLGEVDALRIRSNTLDKAEALMDQSKLFKAQAKAAKQAGKNKMIGSLLTGLGTAAGTGVADKWFTASSAAKVPEIAPGMTFPTS